MPLWNIYHPSPTFVNAKLKNDLAKEITKIYTAVGLPPFYVVVLFHNLNEGNVFIGGDPQPSSSPHREHPFIRIEISNIARRLPGGVNPHKEKFLERVDAALKPFIEDKGYDWEYHVLETDRSLWKINGVKPPGTRSKGEKKWFEANHVVPLEEGEWEAEADIKA